jgi:hypothetical protein
MNAQQLELNVPRTTEQDLRLRRVRSAARPATQKAAALRKNPMMRHLLSALGRREEIGHYGRLVFAMVGHHFLEDGELAHLLARDPAFSLEDAEALCRQVRERDYNPPRPERIAEWQRSQSFPICPEGDPRQCNVYRDLEFPPEVYEHIREFYRA